ncbi:hypothetical protein Tco_1226933 [Tanacetum coccineum]
MDGIFSIKARDMDTKLLSAPELNNTLARDCTDICNALSLHRHDKLLTLVAGCFQWLALCFYSSCWGGSTSPEGFLPSTLLLLVIIVAVCMFVLVVVVVEEWLPKRTTTTAAPAMTQAVIGQLVANSVAAALKVFIGGLPHSIKGTVTASKPQTLEEAITIT